MKILMIEAEDTILQDVVTFLSEKTSCHVRNLSLTTDSLNVLTFSSLEIHLQEQMIIHNGDHIPLFDGWKALLEYAPTIIMLIVLIMGFLVSGIFSSEFQLKADSIFFSTRLGRNRGTVAKIKAGFLMVTVIYWGVMLVYSAVVLISLGTDGASCAIQTGLGGWKSFYNISYLQDYLLTMIGGYLGSLFILTFSMLVTAKTRSTVLAVTIPFILLFIPSFLNGISILSNVLGLLPDQLLQISEDVCLGI